MLYDKTSLVRSLVPKSYHFDGYNELKIPNSRDRPFFSDNDIKMGDYYLSIRLVNQDTIELSFSSVCPLGKLIFQRIKLTLEVFVSKLKEMIQNNCDFITFEIGITYRDCAYEENCKHCSGVNEACTFLRKKYPKQLMAAVSFNPTSVKKALNMYFELVNKQLIKGEKHMKKGKNFLGMNLEFGVSKDPNIASTLMGLAVKNPNTEDWYIFDKVNKTRTNCASLKIGDFPIVLLPTINLQVGDLIKKNGKYYFVQSPVDGNASIKLLDATEGTYVDMAPETNLILGNRTIYTKVLAFDMNSLKDNSSNENIGSNMLAAICMLQWSKKENGEDAEFSIDNIDDNSFNGLGSYLPALMLANQGNMNGMLGGNSLPMLMAMGSGDNNETMQMLVLSQLLGENNTLQIPGFSDMNSSSSPSSTAVVCEKCNRTYAEGTKFCPECGNKTKAIVNNCRKCGAKLSPGAKFCHICGTKVNMDTCPNCGNTIEDGAKFCSNCGKNLEEKSNTDSSSKAEE